MSRPEDTAHWTTEADLVDHFSRHGPKLGLLNEAEYDASARETIRTGRRFTYFDVNSGRPRVGYFERRSGLFVALRQNEAVILTHYLADEAYVRHLRDSTYS